MIDWTAVFATLPDQFTLDQWLQATEGQLKWRQTEPRWRSRRL